MSKKEKIALIMSIADVALRNQSLRWMLKAGEITEDDLAVVDAQEAARQYPELRERFKTDPGLRVLLDVFRDYPIYLARALVQAAPDVFYSYGFAYRNSVKLRADLGTIGVDPIRGSGGSGAAVYLERLPKEVRQDLVALLQEFYFHEWLKDFSDSPEDALALLDLARGEATNDLARQALSGLHDECQQVFQGVFPDFVEEFHASRFPSFHVRWWIHHISEVPRVLNMGDTGTQKTAFAAVGLRHYGCQRALIVCPTRASLQWQREIQGYLRTPADRVLLVDSPRMIAEAAVATPWYTIIGYSTLIARGVVDQLKAIPFDGLVLDECHYCNHDSHRAIAASQLVNELPLRRFLALSATPWENHPREMAALATMLRPTTFASPEVFRQSRPEHPRFLRELFRAQVLQVELRELTRLPSITPSPWEDLFGAELIEPTPEQRAVYDFVREQEDDELPATEKMKRLLWAAIHPHKLKPLYAWPAALVSHFDHPELSAKLAWLKNRITLELARGAKVVVGTGIYVAGITCPNDNGDEQWVGNQLRQWFGEHRVLILDGSVLKSAGHSGLVKRERLIEQWRNDPETRILLVSIPACPDALNLSVPKLSGITRLFVTTLSYPWKPWKQFQGRFWRPGLGVEMEYRVPVLRGTIDHSLLRMLRRKWELQQMFRALVPLTEEEFARLDQGEYLRWLADELRSDYQRVIFIGNNFRGQGEAHAIAMFEAEYASTTTAEAYASAFLACHDCATSGHIARFMQPAIEAMQQQGGLVDSTGVTILDAGCGPLTLERRLAQPVYGVDMNRHMIELAKPKSPCGGCNVHVGFLSQLPAEWTGRFELTVASLVLDWTSIESEVGREPDRLTVLRELVRVTHPVAGHVWITVTHRSLTSELFQGWVAALEQQGFEIVRDFTALFRSKDHEPGQVPFEFWSICFSPKGKQLTLVDPQALRFTFEQSRTKKKRSADGDDDQLRSPKVQRMVKYQKFEAVHRSGEIVQQSDAIERAVSGEVVRLMRNPDLRGWKPHRKPILAWEHLWRSYVKRPEVAEELRRRGFL
ncbi:MAG: hypothetical protein G01um101431_767 [Parcubacteria group bacterium Gr01-1014_31]|nr:MAG: hypothetical protein G01um101431_767 [Parcubacteria group bacterium Gr01-1014_31]